MMRAAAVAAALAFLFPLVPGTQAWIEEDDAGTGGDAGDTVDDATPVGEGRWYGRLVGPDDPADVYAFPVRAGETIYVDFWSSLWVGIGSSGALAEGPGAWTLLAPDGSEFDESPLVDASADGVWHLVVARMPEWSAAPVDYDLEFVVALDDDAGSGRDATEDAAVDVASVREFDGMLHPHDAADWYELGRSTTPAIVKVTVESGADVGKLLITLGDDRRTWEPFRGTARWITPRDSVVRMKVETCYNPWSPDQMRFSCYWRGPPSMDVPYTVRFDWTPMDVAEPALAPSVVATLPQSASALCVHDGALRAVGSTQEYEISSTGIAVVREGWLGHHACESDGAGRVFYEASDGRITYWNGTGEARLVESYGRPLFGPEGELFLVDHRVVQVSEDRNVQLLVPYAPGAMAFGPDGRLYAANRWNGTIDRIDLGSGGVEPAFDLGLDVERLAFDETGRVYTVQIGKLFRFDPASGQTTLLGPVPPGFRLVPHDDALYGVWGREVWKLDVPGAFEGFHAPFEPLDPPEVSVVSIEDITPFRAPHEDRLVFRVVVRNDGPSYAEPVSTFVRVTTPDPWSEGDEFDYGIASNGEAVRLAPGASHEFIIEWRPDGLGLVAGNVTATATVRAFADGDPSDNTRSIETCIRVCPP